MALLYLCRPKSDYSNYGWQIVYGTSLWGALTTEDDSVSYIECTQPARYYHALLDKPQVGVCYASTFYARLKSGFSTPDVTYGTSVAGVFTSDVDTYTTTASWANTSFALTPDPNDVNLATFGAGLEADGITNPTAPQCSWVRLDLNYDPPSGEGYAYLIASFLGPLVAVGLEAVPGLIRHFNAEASARPWWHPWARHRIGVEDAGKVWRSLREARWPVYST